MRKSVKVPIGSMGSSRAGEDVRPALDVVWRNAGKLLDSDLPFPLTNADSPIITKQAALQATIKKEK